MKRCKTQVLRVCLFCLATVPAYCQRGTIGIDVGQASDKFGSLPVQSGLELAIDGQITVLKPSQKKGGPSIIAGGEMRLPTDIANHAREYALYGGLMFQARNLSIGVNAQVSKLILPPATFQTQVLNRYKMELLELPVTIKYTFGPAGRAYLQAQGAPEFSPRFRNPAAFSPVLLPFPNLDHGYFVRGTAGYSLGKFYAKGSYENRYFKFAPNAGNPNGLYTWRTNLIFGGVGLVF